MDWPQLLQFFDRLSLLSVLSPVPLTEIAANGLNKPTREKAQTPVKVISAGQRKKSR